MIYEVTDALKISALFGKWEEPMIWSCLQGVMGKIYADNLNNPTAAMAILGDFTFFAGKPNMELVSSKPAWCTQDFMIMVPQNKHWETMITQFYGTRAKTVRRYATKKEPHIFDRDELEKIVGSLPKQYTLSMIDEQIYQMCRAETWCADWVSQFPSYEDYRLLGLGVVLRENDRILSGASSYARYREGIEVQIDTQKEYRRRGFARICGANLILECRKRNLYPSWDAQNMGSMALAEKLGYQYSHAYTAVEIWGY